MQTVSFLFQRRPWLGLGILVLALGASCTDDKDQRVPPPQPLYHLTMEAEMPPRHSRERITQDLALDILEYKDFVKDSISKERKWGNSFVVGNKRYMSLRSWRADLNSLRDSLLATGTADLSDTLKVNQGHSSHSIPTPEEYRSH